MQTAPRRRGWAVFVSLLLCCLLAACMATESYSGALPRQEGGGDALSPGRPQSVPALQPAGPVEHRVRFSAVGDNLIHNAIYDSARRDASEKQQGAEFDFSYCYENIRHHFQQYDVNWINQETLVNDEFSPSTYPLFSTPGALGQATYDAGFRVFALSNNHTYDCGAAGVDATLQWWRQMQERHEDLFYYGLYSNREDDSGIALQQVNGIAIAYVAFTHGTNGLTLPADAEHFVIYTSELEAMERKVRHARAMADVVVVSTHWGTENSHTIHGSQRTLGQQLADWGADVIIGTHPHVIQDLEWVQSADGRQALLIHSLGNFLSAQSEPNQLVGLLVSFELVQIEYPDGTRGALRIENVRAQPVVTQYEAPAYGYYDHPRTYLFSDYSDELAARHHVKTKNGAWSRAYIQQLCEEHVSSEFLVLE